MKKRTIKPMDVIRILEAVVLVSIIIGLGLMLTNNIRLVALSFISFGVGVIAVLGILILLGLMTIVNWNIVKDRLV